jgi:hypothetical protein
MDEKLELVVLTEVDNEFELGIVTAILDDNGIPFIIKNSGSGGYMRIITGSSPYGTKVLVEKSTYERAKDIITPITEEE